ncbi:MAG: tetratricopeptide repeat protein [Ferruginibacter sp.]
MKILFPLIAACMISGGIAKSQSIDDAQKYLYYERYESAKNILQSIISKADAPPEGWYWLGEIYLHENKIDSAEKVLQEGTAYFTKQDFSKKKNPLLFIGNAHLLLEKGDTAAARKLFDDVLNEGKYKNAEALLAVAKANLESEHGDSLWAIELLDKAIKRDKKNPEIYTTLGDAYRKMVDGSNAIINYDKALEVNPAYAEAMYKKGKIYKTQNNPEIYVDRFTKALAADSNYAPALYELYYHYYFTDVVKADGFLKAYIRKSDPSPEHAYMLADLHYVSKKWDVAVKEAKDILANDAANAQPRLYKLIAYSQAALGDSTGALRNMNTYFEKQNDTGFVAKDFAMKAALLEKLDTNKSVAIDWYKKALAREHNQEDSLEYIVSLANLQKQLGNRDREAVWREKAYSLKEQPTNLDLYKWGMALYSAENFVKADSVFAIYEEKYPDQVHGYLWRARANALIDTTMQQGLAVPHYTKLIELISKDTAANKPLLVRAYEYLGAYEANTTKDFAASLGYYDKILELEPDNGDAKKNAELLAKWIEDGQNGKDNKDSK